MQHDHVRSMELAGPQHRREFLNCNCEQNFIGYMAAPLPRIVWLLWLQGWHTAPYAVRCVLQSWRKHNPGWLVVTLDESNFGEHLPLDKHPPVRWSPQARSDVLRLRLLAAHGGVWADATMLCMGSLDRWVWRAVSASGFWMYHTDNWTRRPASWFLIGTNSSLIIKRWAAAVDTYIREHDQPTSYFWLDSLFMRMDIDKTKQDFASAWNRVPSIDSGITGSSHSLGKARGTKPLGPRYACQLSGPLPHALKLDKRTALLSEAANRSDSSSSRRSGSDGLRGGGGILGLQNNHYAVYRSLGSPVCPSAPPASPSLMRSQAVRRRTISMAATAVVPSRPAALPGFNPGRSLRPPSENQGRRGRRPSEARRQLSVSAGGTADGGAPTTAPSCVVVVSDFNRSASVRIVAREAAGHGCKTHVVSKSPTGCALHGELPCTALPNVGRDAGAALDYVTSHYDSLADVVIFTGASIKKHDRLHRLRALLAGARTTACSFDCASLPPVFQPLNFADAAKDLGSISGFRVRKWGRNALVPATPTPFHVWVSAHVGPFEEHQSEAACYNVVWRSTRALLRERPRSFYAGLAAQVNVADSTEAVHFIERALGSIFGHGYSRERQAACAVPFSRGPGLDATPARRVTRAGHAFRRSAAVSTTTRVPSPSSPPEKSAMQEAEGANGAGPALIGGVQARAVAEFRKLEAQCGPSWPGLVKAAHKKSQRLLATRASMRGSPGVTHRSGR